MHMKYLLIIFVILSMIMLVNALDFSRLCYQEDAIDVNQSGIDDVDCGLKYTGSYSMLNNSIDVGYLYINYTKPDGLLITDNYWRFKTGLNTTYNASIPEQCLNLSNGQLEFRINDTSNYNGVVGTGYYCYNGYKYIFLYEEMHGALPATRENNLKGNISMFHDGNWSTYIAYGYYPTPYPEERYTWAWNGTGDTIAYVYEEAMLWNLNPLTENSQTYNSTVYETSVQGFMINITYNNNSYLLSNAIFNYNNVSYSTTSQSQGNNIVFSKSLDIDLASSNDENRTFYWILSLTNTTGTYFSNSTFHNQTVKYINLTNCSGSIIVKALNFTAYDETTLLKIPSWNFKTVFNYYTGSGIYSRNISFDNSNIAEEDICINNDSSLKITGQIQYSANGYDTSSYNLVHFPINNQTQNISLYLLNTSLTTPFIILVQSQNQLPLMDYLVYIYRYSPSSSSPYLSQIIKTDSTGKSIAYFEINTVDYKFVIADTNNNIVYTSEKRKIIPETTPYTLTFTVGDILPSPFVYYNNVTQINWQLAYNKATYVASLSYTDSNSSFQSALFTVRAMNVSGSDNIVCNQTLSVSVGILVCNLTGNSSGTYYSEFYINRGSGYMFVDRLSFEIVGISSVTGNLGVLGAFFILLIFAFAFAWNEVAGILSICVGWTIVNLIGFLHFGLLGISVVWGIGIVILAILEWG